MSKRCELEVKPNTCGDGDCVPKHAALCCMDCDTPDCDYRCEQSKTTVILKGIALVSMAVNYKREVK